MRKTEKKSRNGAKQAPESLNGNGLEKLIRRRAYELWEQSGRQDGCHTQHWLIAEREVVQQPKLSTQ